MRELKFAILFLITISLGCEQSEEKGVLVKDDSSLNKTLKKDSINLSNTNTIKEEIKNLIRQTLSWQDTKNGIDETPFLYDPLDSNCIGFDLEKHKQNLIKLRESNFFADEFIENYDKIILTLDKRIKNREIDKFRMGELPTFSFANNESPWCLCQDVPYEKPNPWESVEIEVINLDNSSGVLNWRWGKLELNSDPNWKKSVYKFKVDKEKGKWRISYLQGFDFAVSTWKG